MIGKSEAMSRVNHLVQIFVVAVDVEVSDNRIHLWLDKVPLSSGYIAPNIIVRMRECFIECTDGAIVCAPPCWIESSEVHDENLESGRDHHDAEHGVQNPLEQLEFPYVWKHLLDRDGFHFHDGRLVVRSLSSFVKSL